MEIPDSVTEIATQAFQDCAALEQLEIPASVQKIGEGVFDGCVNLQQLSILNPDCEIFDLETTISSAARIRGMSVSTAHEYASKYERAFTPMDRLRGDFDGDGELTLNDAFSVLAAYARSAAGNPDALTDLEQYAADYDGDGTVALEDAFGILQAYSKNAAGNGCASGSV